MTYQWHGKLFLTGELVCLTGLHIGGTSTGIEIGGVENTVIKDPLTDHPYVPGSSLKGKLRSLLEWKLGLIEKHSKHGGYVAYECKELAVQRDPNNPGTWDAAYVIARLFGPASDDPKVRFTAKPSRVTVRDCFPTPDTLKLWETWLGKGEFTEIKTENALDRITSEANPRPLERVPKGSRFDWTLVIDIYEKPADFILLQDLFSALHILEDSTLGGAGSRGSGEVQFESIVMTWRPASYYQAGQGEQTLNLPGSKLTDILQGWSSIVWPQ